MKSLLLGCGNNHKKKITFPDEDWLGELVTIDMNPNCGASIVMDINPDNYPLPFEDETFSEIHAYDSLEHWGRIGDWKGWFDEMSEYHRLLKPDGFFATIVPFSEDRFADPGHVRFFGANHFFMLQQSWYDEKLAIGWQVSDYRWYWKKNFFVCVVDSQSEHHCAVLLQKKP